MRGQWLLSGKLRRSTASLGKDLVWAGSVDYDCAYFRRLALPLASAVLPGVLERKRPAWQRARR